MAGSSLSIEKDARVQGPKGISRAACRSTWRWTATRKATSRPKNRGGISGFLAKLVRCQVCRSFGFRRNTDYAARQKPELRQVPADSVFTTL